MHLRKMGVLLLLSAMALWISVKSSWFSGFKPSVSLLVICQVLLSIMESGVLTFPTIIVECLFFSFNSVIVVMYFEALLLDNNMLIFVMSS